MAGEEVVAVEEVVDLMEIVAVLHAEHLLIETVTRL